MDFKDKFKKDESFDLDYSKVRKEVNIDKYIDYKNENNFISKKLIISLGLLSLIFIVLVSIALKEFNNPLINPDPGLENNPPDNQIVNDYQVNYSLTDEDLIGIAAFKVFDKKQTLLTSSNIKTKRNRIKEINDEYLKINYAFEYIKIENAIKFDFVIKDNIDTLAYQILEAECGVGNVEVVIADFTTYIYLDEGNIPHRSIVDRLISIRGSEGYYTIITNSGTRTETGWTDFFSSHKKLTSTSVEKDFTPPILTIYVEEIGADLKIGFKGALDILGKEDFYDVNKELVKGPFEEASADEMYSALDLAKVPVKNVICEVVQIIPVIIESVNYTCLIVSNDLYDFDKVYVNKTTICDFLDDIEVDDKINIYFNFYYSNYKPKSIIALKIERVENNEEVAS